MDFERRELHQWKVFVNEACPYSNIYNATLKILHTTEFNDHELSLNQKREDGKCKCDDKRDKLKRFKMLFMMKMKHIS